MALEGSIRDFGLADIFQLLYFHKKTGTLMLTRQSDSVRLVFYEGNVLSAESWNRAEEQKIGRVLLKEGLIREQDIRSALGEQKKTGARLAEIFLKKGLVDEEDIKKALILQTTDTVTKLFSWSDGTYGFDPHPVFPNEGIPISLDTQHLLMEGLRVVDEWSIVEGKMTLDTVLKRTNETGDLTPQEEELLRFVNGENEAGSIIELSGLEDFEVLRILVSLMGKGIIEVVEVTPVVTEAVSPPPVSRPAILLKSLSIFILISAFGVSILAAIYQKGSPMSLSVFWDAGSCHRLKTVKEIDKLRFMADVYKYKNGSYPKQLDQVGRAKDMWGRPYIYKIETDNLSVRSAGPDGKVGTEDDIY